MANGFWFYENWLESIKDLAKGDERDRRDALELTLALCQYGMTGEVPENMSPTVSSNFRSMQVGVDTSKSRYNKSIEDGKKGGRPATKREQAMEYIEQGLSKQDVIAKGISESTYKRALADLKAQKVQNSGSRILDQEDGQVQNSMDEEGSKGSKVGQNDFDLEESKSSKGVQNSFDPRAQISGYIF